ncbi:MAG: hypothetical protein HY774_22630 [Acidobacteria bacterium]|nr:hypothetical protein [Acidobacteriota bacterium]
MTITSADRKSVGVYEFRKNKSDLRLEVNNQADNESDSGTILVIEDAVLLIKELKTESGYEIDVLDVNILSVKLAYALLVRAFPKGPDSISDPLDASIVERKNEISVNNISAGLEIPPPWSLKGTATPVGTEYIQFDLTFIFQSPDDEKVKETMQFTGKWYKNSPELEIPAEMPIQDWQIFSLGPIQSTTAQGGMIFDYSAIKMKKLGTIGELRKALQAGKQGKK